MKPGKNTKAQLLTTAIKLFAETGFHGTTVDMIVNTAGVNKRMVYHYFGNKKGLYQAVIKEVYDHLSALEIRAFEKPKTFRENLTDIITLYFDFLDQNPHFTRILQWENLNKGKGIESTDPKLFKNPILEALEKELHKARRTHQTRRDLDAKHLLISLIGLCQIYSSNRYTLSQILEIDLHSPQSLAIRKEHTIKLLLHGILKKEKILQ
jgi:TetR/AcrR family transcriptional regulator